MTKPVDAKNLTHEDGAALAQAIRRAASDCGQSWSKARTDDPACTILAGYIMAVLPKYGYKIAYDFGGELDPRTGCPRPTASDQEV